MNWYICEAERVLFENYGIKGKVIKTFSGYEDLNFLINDLTDETKYVLKIINSSDSQKTGLVEAVADVIVEVQRHCPCSRIVETMRGVRTTLISDGEEISQLRQRHSFDLLAFSSLCAAVGEFVGKFCTQMKIIRNFPTILQRESMGCKIENIRIIRERLEILTSVTIREICSSVIVSIEEVCSDPIYCSMTKGIIHGDLTLENLIFEEGLTPNRYRVRGVIDFMDASLSCYAFEIATMLCSVMHTAVLKQLDPFDAARITLKAIRRYFNLNLTELDILYNAVMGRLCILLVYCGHDILQSEQTAHHVHLDFNVLEELLEQLWTLGAGQWRKLVTELDE